MEVLESCFFCRYEKLHRWEDALAAYSTKAHSATSADELQSATLGLFLNLLNRTKNNFTPNSAVEFVKAWLSYLEM
jgi:hypothetical protein